MAEYRYTAISAITMALCNKWKNRKAAMAGYN
jgi:hypothetical protein